MIKLLYEGSSKPFFKLNNDPTNKIAILIHSFFIKIYLKQLTSVKI